MTVKRAKRVIRTFADLTDDECRSLANCMKAIGDAARQGKPLTRKQIVTLARAGRETNDKEQ